MKKLIKPLFIFGSALAMSSCYSDNLAELTPSNGLGALTCDTTGTISYMSQIVPILQNNCGVNNSCHSSSNTSSYDLSTYTGVHNVVRSGQLLSSITWSGSPSNMPKNGSKMSDCNITKIQKWITAGALNN
ncbi:MAG: hypothetical protein WCG87_08375 [Bacteroidota bacterium]